MEPLGRIARLVIRDNDTGKGDLILGACTKSQDIFKSGSVWEISNKANGEFVLKEIGKSHIHPTRQIKEEVPRTACWEDSVDDILKHTGKTLALTEEEYKAYRNRDKKPERLVSVETKRIAIPEEKIVSVETKRIAIPEERLVEAETNPIAIPEEKIVEADTKKLAKKLFQAVNGGNLKKVKKWISKGANIHADDEEALRWAANKGYLKIVKLLVKHGADINARHGFALRYAAMNGYLDVVKCLVEHGADIHTNVEEALRWAATYNRLDVIEYLIKHRTNTKANKGKPLHSFAAS